MSDINQEGDDVFENRLAAHRRQIDALTPPKMKDPRFDEAKKLVVDLLEGRTTMPRAINMTAINTDAQVLPFDKDVR